MTTNKWRTSFSRAVMLLLAMTTSAGALFAYSVLTHEEVVDLVWTSAIRPLLLLRFPHLTENEITEAHSYAYGGSVIQDLGDYPCGSKNRSELVHYLRTRHLHSAQPHAR